ncbi:retron Ec78 anti-phage system effector HNH endonuclease PtuB [Tahibacter amnicola]|uniref:TIGR02646 family protein n=1 Tax=Tahibacter amnicola TaxID=2976241 RepID=A0ABY6BI61_9GAMM|nr:retron Ec78 anti-phage system effector HNH endonuclease PtuB [Tahibacter amnicola]UXI69694.1 TIGR02646 family protein [Tahibacter amnicola]
MHKLNRGLDGPPCLRKFRHGHHYWGDISVPDGYVEIWLCLDDMQGSRCAYCEAPIDEHNRHVEHFWRRRDHPRRTFDWTNLFGSCNSGNSCGIHKDQGAGAYDPALLIKPDEDDPDDFFQFLSDGSIVSKESLDAIQKRRADETLRVFNLNGHAALRWRRQQAAAGYVQTALELWGLRPECDQEEWQQLLHQELAAITGHPFETAIRHTLTIVR